MEAAANSYFSTLYQRIRTLTVNVNTSTATDAKRQPEEIQPELSPNERARPVSCDYLVESRNPLSSQLISATG